MTKNSGSYMNLNIKSSRAKLSPAEIWGLSLKIVYINVNDKEKKIMYVCINIYWAIGLMSRVFASGLGDRGSIPGWVIPKTQKNGTWICLA